MHQAHKIEDTDALDVDGYYYYLLIVWLWGLSTIKEDIPEDLKEVYKNTEERTDERNTEERTLYQ